MESKHPWKARLIIGILMLVLAFIGMVVTDVHAGGGFIYWRWVIPVYAILALWLSWYTHLKAPDTRLVTFAHEILHWIGLILAELLVSWFVHLGTLSRFNAGLVDLTLLALAIYLAGVYLEKTFLLIGMVLGVLALFSAFVAQYLWAIAIPILIGAVAVIGIMVRVSHKKLQK